jgi:hypothetical protein
VLGRVLGLQLVGFVSGGCTQFGSNDEHPESAVVGYFFEEVVIEGLVESVVLFHVFIRLLIRGIIVLDLNS